MKTIADPLNALGQGLASIRRQFQIPDTFPPEVLAAAEAAAARRLTNHFDRTAEPFVTLDPASSTDLDQAFHIETDGSDLLLRYAIADVAWFVEDGDVVDQEAWRRGTTQYLPDGKAGLYPPVLSEGAASLLPEAPRPAVIFSVRVAPDGSARLDGAERAIIQSRAKLAYDSARTTDLPAGFAELSDRVQRAEAQRGAARVNPPAQELRMTGSGRYQLMLRAPLESEVRNAALSLATNLAIADLLLAHQTGLFRVMSEPDEGAVSRLRHTARAFGITWPDEVPLTSIERGLNLHDARQAAFMLAIQRASQGAEYAPYREGETPWHAAVAATYAHSTAPLRRLADRYVVQATLAIANGRAVSPHVEAAFAKLPAVMARAGALSSQLERAAIDLAEAVLLSGREGEAFAAVVTEIDDRGARIQLRDLPVASRCPADHVSAGEHLSVILVEANVALRTLTFRRNAGQE